MLGPRNTINCESCGKPHQTCLLAAPTTNPHEFTHSTTTQPVSALRVGCWWRKCKGIPPLAAGHQEPQSDKTPEETPHEAHSTVVSSTDLRGELLRVPVRPRGQGARTAKGQSSTRGSSPIEEDKSPPSPLLAPRLRHASRFHSRLRTSASLMPPFLLICVYPYPTGKRGPQQHPIPTNPHGGTTNFTAGRTGKSKYHALPCLVQRVLLPTQSLSINHAHANTEHNTITPRASAKRSPQVRNPLAHDDRVKTNPARFSPLVHPHPCTQNHPKTH